MRFYTKHFMWLGGPKWNIRGGIFLGARGQVINDFFNVLLFFFQDIGRNHIRLVRHLNFNATNSYDDEITRNVEIC